MDDEIRRRNAAATQRQIEFSEALPKALRDEEDAIPSVIRAMNASSRSKLQRIYRIEMQSWSTGIHLLRAKRDVQIVAI